MPSLVKRFRSSALALVVALTVLAAPLSALAAPANFQSYEVTLLGASAGQPVLLISGNMAPNVKLPAESALSIPSGAQPFWVGEILGGDPSKDPVLQYTTEKANGYDLVKFTTKNRIAQVEIDAAGSVTVKGDTRDIVSRWTPPADAEAVKFIVEVPADATVADVKGVEKAPTANGGPVYYSKTFRSVKAGKPLEFKLSYKGGTAVPSQPPAAQQPAGTPAQSGGGNSNLFAMVGVLGLILIVVFALMVKTQKASKPASEDVEEKPRRTAKPEAVVVADEDGDSMFDFDDSAETAPKAVETPREAPAKKRKSASKTAAVEATDECAECGVAMAPNAKFCPECGTKVA